MTRTARSLLAVGCAAVIALSAAGCGSDSKSSSNPSSAPSTAAALSDADFKTQANALCGTANGEIKTLETNFQAAAPADSDAIAVSIADRIDALVASIKALGVPSDLSAGVTDLLDTVSGVSSQIRDGKSAFFNNATSDPFADADTKSVALGLDTCAGNN